MQLQHHKVHRPLSSIQLMEEQMPVAKPCKLQYIVLLVVVVVVVEDPIRQAPQPANLYGALTEESCDSQRFTPLTCN